MGVPRHTSLFAFDIDYKPFKHETMYFTVLRERESGLPVGPSRDGQTLGEEPWEYTVLGDIVDMPFVTRSRPGETQERVHSEERYSWVDTDEDTGDDHESVLELSC